MAYSWGIQVDFCCLYCAWRCCSLAASLCKQIQALELQGCISSQPNAQDDAIRHVQHALVCRYLQLAKDLAGGLLESCAACISKTKLHLCYNRHDPTRSASVRSCHYLPLPRDLTWVSLRPAAQLHSSFELQCIELSHIELLLSSSRFTERKLAAALPNLPTCAQLPRLPCRALGIICNAAVHKAPASAISQYVYVDRARCSYAYASLPSCS